MRILSHAERKEWLTPAEFADKYGIHVLTVYRWVKQGRLSHKRLGRSIRIDDREEAMHVS